MDVGEVHFLAFNIVRITDSEMALSLTTRASIAILLKAETVKQYSESVLETEDADDLEELTECLPEV